MKFGLKNQTVLLIIDCLSRFSSIEQAIIYGSRAMGNFKPGSDIDLTLKGGDILFSDLLKLENALDDLLLPYKFDLSIFHLIENEDLIQHINRVGKVFFINKERGNEAKLMK